MTANEGTVTKPRSGSVIGFVVLTAVLAGAVNALGNSVALGEEWRVAAFAVALLAVALGFGVVAPVSGDRIDFVNVVMAGLGVVLLFFDAGADRNRIVAAQEHATALNRYESFVQKRPELERVLGDTNGLLQRVHEATRAPETVARREQAFKDCQAAQSDQAGRNLQHQLEEQQRRIQSSPFSPGAPGSIRVPRLDDGLAPPVDCRSLVPNLDMLASVDTPARLVEIISGPNGPGLTRELGDVFGGLTLDDVVTYVRLTEGGDATAVLQAEQKRLGDDVLRWRTTFESLSPSVGRRPAWLSWFRQFLWPYVFLCALAMNLARKDYLM
jgi:hypothetical protein